MERKKRNMENKETSTKGIELIKRFEGLRLNSYQDSAGVWTIGYGHTYRVKEDMLITDELAISYLKSDLLDAEKGVNRLVKSVINQNQFDALVSFTFNLGVGNFSCSTLLKKINKNPNEPTIEKEFMKWVYANKKKLDGLIRRRKAEATLYFLND